MAYDVDDPVQYKDEPTWAQQGVDPPGFLGGHSDFVLYGLYNGAFAKGPPDPAQNLDVTSASGSNFMPAWRFVQSSNTNITAKQVRDTASPSGSNLRFTFAAGSANDEAYVEQITDVGGSRDRASGGRFRVTALPAVATVFTSWVELQYLDVDGNSVGPATSSSIVVTTTAVLNVAAFASSGGSPPANAARLRARVGVRRAAAAVGATGSVDFNSARSDRAYDTLLLGERNVGSTGIYGPGFIYQSGGAVTVGPDGAIPYALSVSKPLGLISAQLSVANDAFQVQNGHLEVSEITAPSTPGAGFYAIYAKSDSHLYGLNDGGTEVALDTIDGTFTPAAAYATAGTSSWAVTTQVGFYTKVGTRVLFNFFYQGVPTNGTASGNLQITGLPFTSQNTTNDQAQLATVISGYTKAGYTMVTGRVGVNTTLIVFDASGSGVATGLVTVADVPTGGTVIIKCSGHYST